LLPRHSTLRCPASRWRRKVNCALALATPLKLSHSCCCRPCARRHRHTVFLRSPADAPAFAHPTPSYPSSDRQFLLLVVTALPPPLARVHTGLLRPHASTPIAWYPCHWLAHLHGGTSAFFCSVSARPTHHPPPLTPTAHFPLSPPPACTRSGARPVQRGVPGKVRPRPHDGCIEEGADL